MTPTRRALILCTGNSARSQMAEGLVNHFLKGQWKAYSAGTQPTGAVHPLAVAAMAELGIDISAQRSKSVEEFHDMPFDAVITVCDDAAENCPIWLGPGLVKHIGFPDPAAVEGSGEEKLDAFREARNGLRLKILDYLKGIEVVPDRTPGSRETFDWELHRLRDATLTLGTLVQNYITDSVECLKARDLSRARELIRHDASINRHRHDIELFALTLIATQQPVAGDLRQIASALDVSGELERIGDYAKGIAKIVILMGSEPMIKPLVDIPPMAEKVVEMIRAALDALARGDVEAAYEIPKRDDEVDALYNHVYGDLLALAGKDPASFDQVNYLLWIAHNLERAADRVTNLCERIIFTNTGELVSLDKDEELLAG
jgi:phosphate transport system protein